MEIDLRETKHHNKVSEQNFDRLIGIDEHKTALLNNLCLLFDTASLDSWYEKHHRSQLPFFKDIVSGTPLIILAGDVGCGKTALAHSIGSPLSKRLDKRVISFETPSNIRGSGRVGEISNRISAAFHQVKLKIQKNDLGLLIIDEGDDLATDREQNQAHHEDRAGLNVLIKEIDTISRDDKNLIVILITNRLKVLDPAIVRRSSEIIHFKRPGKNERRNLFKSMFNGKMTAEDIEKLVDASERKDVPYSFSDLVQKVAKQAIIKAVEQDRPLDHNLYMDVLKRIEPSPSIN